MKTKLILISSILLFGLFACNQSSDNNSKPSKIEQIEKVKSNIPEWVRSANIYEVNIRQYTPEGNFEAFMEHLPRLKEQGVDILWLMPIFPIGEKNRKGSLGSYYSVRDYMDVNSEFGNKEDFRTLVEKAHELEMYVILDWVANHTSWDNLMIEDHPDWYTKDSLGNIIPPVPDWADVADLNYDNTELRNYMIEALKYWVRDFNIDGYRCDVAGDVPTDFWNTVKPELDKIKPVFMLAESEKPELLKSAFNMDYSWDLHSIMNDVAQGEKNANDIREYFISTKDLYEFDDIKLNFITNHDENSWNGTVKERMGEAAKAMAVFSATIPGMPLMYSGQEAGLDKRLEFFDKDEIEWRQDEMGDLYLKLFQLKKNNKALWNANFGGEMKIIGTSEDESVFAFMREKQNFKVFVVINMSDETKKFTFNEKCYCDSYVDVFTGQKFEILDEIGMRLGPWEYLIYESR